MTTNFIDVLSVQSKQRQHQNANTLLTQHTIFLFEETPFQHRILDKFNKNCKKSATKLINIRFPGPKIFCQKYFAKSQNRIRAFLASRLIYDISENSLRLTLSKTKLFQRSAGSVSGIKKLNLGYLKLTSFSIFNPINQQFREYRIELHLRSFDGHFQRWHWREYWSHVIAFTWFLTTNSLLRSQPRLSCSTNKIKYILRQSWYLTFTATLIQDFSFFPANKYLKSVQI